MEMEYKDPSKKGRWIVLLGVVLAIVAGASAFYLLNNAQQQAGTSGLKTVQGYVAARPILARKPIVAEDLQLRKDIPLDGTNANVISDERQLVGRLLAVDVTQGQLLTTNLLTSGTVGLGFAILKPDETVAPDSEAWRAVSITVELAGIARVTTMNGSSTSCAHRVTVGVVDDPGSRRRSRCGLRCRLAIGQRRRS